MSAMSPMSASNMVRARAPHGAPQRDSLNTHSDHMVHHSPTASHSLRSHGAPQEVTYDTNWFEEGRKVPSACLMDRQASSDPWRFGNWQYARTVLWKDSRGETHLSIVTEVRQRARDACPNPGFLAGTSSKPRFGAWILRMA